MDGWMDRKEDSKPNKQGSVGTSDGDRIWSGWARTMYMLRNTRAGAL